MATHHALANIDIVDEVFQWFDYELTHGYPLEQTSDFVAGESAGEDVETERRRSLASAARTCKSFHEPALRVLWRQLESLIPFFSLLPSFTKVQENVEQPFSSWHPRDIYVSWIRFERQLSGVAALLTVRLASPRLCLVT